MISFIEKGNYMLDENGVFIPRYNYDVATKFSDSAQEELFKMEDTSWWFQYRANVIASLFMKYCNAESVVFDIGGGNGYTSNILKQIKGGV